MMSSRRMYRKKNKGRKSSKEPSNLSQFNPISFLLFIIPMLIITYLTIKYRGESFIIDSIILLSLGIFSIIGLFWINRGRIIQNDIPFLEGWYKALLYITGIVTCFVATGITFFLFQKIIRFSVSVEDLFLYYGSAAIIEEVFFRMFLISLFDKYNKKYLGVVFSSILFMLSHLVVYRESPEMLFITLFSGVIFSFYYIGYKDITIPMIVHMIINLIAVGNLLVQA